MVLGIKVVGEFLRGLSYYFCGIVLNSVIWGGVLFGINCGGNLRTVEGYWGVLGG